MIDITDLLAATGRLSAALMMLFYVTPRQLRDMREPDEPKYHRIKVLLFWLVCLLSVACLITGLRPALLLIVGQSWIALDTVAKNCVTFITVAIAFLIVFLYRGNKRSVGKK